MGKLYKQRASCCPWLDSCWWSQPQADPGSGSGCGYTFVSALTRGLAGNETSVARRIVFCSRMEAWDKLCPKGCCTCVCVCVRACVCVCLVKRGRMLRGKD